MARSIGRSAASSGSNGWQSELPPASQLTLSFEPALPERFASLRELPLLRDTAPEKAR